MVKTSTWSLQLTNCTFSGLLMLGPRRTPPLLPLPSEADAAEKRLSSSDISISGALKRLSSCEYVGSKVDKNQIITQAK